MDADKITLTEDEKSHALVANLNEETAISENDIPKSNSNNENKSNTNCDACSLRRKINSANVAIQCDVEVVESSTIQSKINVANDGKSKISQYFISSKYLKKIRG